VTRRSCVACPRSPSWCAWWERRRRSRASAAAPLPTPFRDDPDVWAFLDHPVLLREIYLLDLAGERILRGGRAIPHESADVLLVFEKTRDRRDVPAALQACLRGDALIAVGPDAAGRERTGKRRAEAPRRRITTSRSACTACTGPGARRLSFTDCQSFRAGCRGRRARLGGSRCDTRDCVVHRSCLRRDARRPDGVYCTTESGAPMMRA
jgi:hypothetical protein